MWRGPSALGSSTCGAIEDSDASRRLLALPATSVVGVYVAHAMEHSLILWRRTLFSWRLVARNLRLFTAMRRISA